MKFSTFKFQFSNIKSGFTRPFLPKQKMGGQAVITTVFICLLVAMIMVSGFSFVTLRSIKASTVLLNSKASYYLSESGIEDLAYRIMKAKVFSSTEVLSLGGFFATTTVVNLSGIEKEITSTSSVLSLTRKTKIKLINGSSVSFHYGVQSGEGGFLLENSSEIDGNAFSNGPVAGTGSGGNYIRGDVISAGPSGSINGIYATGTAYAHNISNSTIDKDAYYVNLVNTTVNGVKYPDSPDETLTNMPISDSQIDEWKAAAEAGGVINSPCPYIINSDATIGSVKINCSLEISNNVNVTITGPIWVVGNITFKNSPVVSLDSSLGSGSIAIVADDPSNRSSGSTVTFNNSVTFQGSGDPNSYILFVSRNESAELGGATVAISSQQSAAGKVLVYAPHGKIELYQSGKLKEVTGYKIHLRNTAKVLYETGLANLLFSSGPSGGYSISEWKESQ